MQAETHWIRALSTSGVCDQWPFFAVGVIVVLGWKWKTINPRATATARAKIGARPSSVERRKSFSLSKLSLCNMKFLGVPSRSNSERSMSRVIHRDDIKGKKVRGSAGPVAGIELIPFFLDNRRAVMFVGNWQNFR